MKGMEMLLYSCWALRPTSGALKFLRGWGTSQICRFPGTPFKTEVLFKHHGVSRDIRVAGEVPWAGYLCPHPRSAFWASPLEPGDQSMLRVRDPWRVTEALLALSPQQGLLPFLASHRGHVGSGGCENCTPSLQLPCSLEEVAFPGTLT